MSLAVRPLSFSWILLFASTAIHQTCAENTVEDWRCNCYKTNGQDAAYFTSHKFYDFRDKTTSDQIPSLLSEAAETSSAPATNDFFNGEEFANFWEMQNWNNSVSLGPESTARVLRVNSRNNIYIEKNGDSQASPKTWLTLRTARQTMFQSSAEMVTVDPGFQFISMRMMARTIGAPGGCTAMFTYRPAPADQPGAKLQEADLEILTKYPKDTVQCTNQPSIDSEGQMIEPATVNVTLPNQAAWSDWALYRMDWTPHMTTWYVNGIRIANISFQTPTDPARIHLNAWSDGGNWTGAMAVKTDAHLHIQWWELLYNSTSEKPKGSECKAVCSIDESKTTGKAIMISNSLAAGRLLDRGTGLSSLIAWIPSTATILVLFFSSSIILS
jgi:hypothetical protein